MSSLKVVALAVSLTTALLGAQAAAGEVVRLAATKTLEHCAPDDHGHCTTRLHTYCLDRVVVGNDTDDFHLLVATLQFNRCVVHDDLGCNRSGLRSRRV